MRLARPPRFTLAGALAGVAVGVSLLFLFGYRFDGVPTLLLVSLAVLGSTLALAVSRGVVAVPFLACVLTLVLAFDPLFGPGPPTALRAFTIDAVFLAVCTALAAAGEWAVRHRQLVRLQFSRTDRTAALVGAVALSSAHLVVRPLVDVEWPQAGVVFVAATVLWTLGGAALSGAVVALGWRRRRLVTPALVVVGTLLGGVAATVRSAPGGGIAPTLLTVVSLGWFVPLVVALVMGWAESRLRDGNPHPSTGS